MNKLLTTCLATLIASTSLLQAHQNDDAQEDKRDFSVTKLSDNIHVLMGINGFTGGNIAILTGNDGVIMVDDSMPPLGDKLKAASRKVTGSDIDFLINTHVHGDHIANNALFAKDGSWIVAHKNLRQHLLEKGNGAGEKVAPEALPVITFDSEMNFHLNGEAAVITHMANGHTDGDAIIHYTEANIIHTGDLMFNGMFPFIDLNSGGNINGYLDAQKKIHDLANDETKIIPGHGPMATKADLQAAVEMLEDSVALIKKHVAEGMSEDEVVKANPLQKYHEKWNWGFITTEKMTRQLYSGLK